MNTPTQAFAGVMVSALTGTSRNLWAIDKAANVDGA